MTKPLRVGVIGCGFFAQNHLAAWHEMDGVSLVAVCDIDRSKAQAAAKAFGADAYDDAAQMLDSAALDLVDIATKMDTHAALVALAADRGVPTIVQKPLAPTFKECVAIVERCEAAGVPLMVHENTRFLTPVRMAREVIDSGRLGTLNFARVAFRTGHDIYANQPYLAKEERFVLLDLGVHMLDVARYLMGEAASLNCRYRTVRKGIAGEDQATVLLGHTSGATSVVEASYASPIHPDPFPELTLHIEGERGSLTVSPGYRMSVYADGELEEVDVSPAMSSWSTPPWHGTQESVLRIQTHFVDALRTGTTPENTGRESLRTYALVFGAYEAGRTGETIALSADGADFSPLRVGGRAGVSLRRGSARA